MSSIKKRLNKLANINKIANVDNEDVLIDELSDSDKKLFEDFEFDDDESYKAYYLDYNEMDLQDMGIDTDEMQDTLVNDYNGVLYNYGI
jgi:hypothetical protein